MLGAPSSVFHDQNETTVLLYRIAAAAALLLFPIGFLFVCWFILSGSVLRKSTAMVQYAPAASVADSMEVAAEGLSKFQVIGLFYKIKFSDSHP